MTLKEAIESGKKIIGRPGIKSNYAFDRDSCYKIFTFEDVMADDWEVESIKKQLTADDIRHAVQDVNLEEGDWGIKIWMVDRLIKKLGL